MTLISKTIYPRFNSKISKEELQKNYLPSKEEIDLALTKARGKEHIALFLIHLKVFQNLHYFVDDSEIPYKITKYIKIKLKVDKDIHILPSKRTVEKYKRDIRQALNVITDSNIIKKLVIDSVEMYEPIKDNKADVFNAVLESLIKQNCELPAFSTIDRWTSSKRSQLNNNLFQYISNKLTMDEKKLLDSLLLVRSGESL